MQQRLTLALVATALAAVLLAGAGVLLLAQLGARSQAETVVDSQLQLAAELVASTGRGELPAPLPRLRAGLQLDRLDLVAVADDGQVYDLGSAGPGRRPRRLPPEPIDGLTLDADQLERLSRDETVIVSVDGDQLAVVQGLRRIDLDVVLDGSSAQAAFRGSKSVVTIGRRARILFAVSSSVIVAASIGVAWLLARRLTRPIRAIEQVTAAVAAGDFSARVAVDGDDELADLGRSVNRMAADLERSRALDQQFLMSVSHDLRTPLAAISGWAEALADGAADDPPRAGRLIAAQAGRLERLVGDLLDLAKLDANRFQLHPADIDARVTVGRTVAGLIPRATELGLALRYDPPDEAVIVRADPDRLAQVVANLIDNGLKFARSAVDVQVRRSGAGAVLVVGDDGPGIDPGDLPYIFERLYRSSRQPARAENPSGLGLAIVRELVSAMGGTVAASSEPGQGASLTVTFPHPPRTGQ